MAGRGWGAASLRHQRAHCTAQYNCHGGLSYLVMRSRLGHDGTVDTLALAGS